MENFLRLYEGRLTSPRQAFFKEKDAFETCGEGNYIEVEVEEGFCLDCYSDIPVNGKLVKDDDRMSELASREASEEDRRKLISDTLTAKKLVDASKNDDQLTEIERRLKYSIGAGVTADEVKTYIEDNA